VPAEDQMAHEVLDSAMGISMFISPCEYPTSPSENLSLPHIDLSNTSMWTDVTQDLSNGLPTKAGTNFPIYAVWGFQTIETKVRAL
jgi:hypothetical protein